MVLLFEFELVYILNVVIILKGCGIVDDLISVDRLWCMKDHLMWEKANLMLEVLDICFQYAGSESFSETANYQIIVNNLGDFSESDETLMFNYDLHISCEIKYEFSLIKWMQSWVGKYVDISISRNRVSYDGCYEAYFDIKLDDIHDFFDYRKSISKADRLFSDDEKRELSKIFWHDGTVPVPDYPLGSLETKFDLNSDIAIDQLAKHHFQRFTTLIEQHGYIFRRVGKRIAVDQEELKQLASFEKLQQIEPRTPETKNMVAIVNNQFEKSVFGKRLADQQSKLDLTD